MESPEIPRPRAQSSVAVRDTMVGISSALSDSRSLKKPLPMESSRLDPFHDESNVGAALDATELGLSCVCGSGRIA